MREILDNIARIGIFGAGLALAGFLVYLLALGLKTLFRLSYRKIRPKFKSMGMFP